MAQPASATTVLTAPALVRNTVLHVRKCLLEKSVWSHGLSCGPCKQGLSSSLSPKVVTWPEPHPRNTLPIINAINPISFHVPPPRFRSLVSERLAFISARKSDSGKSASLCSYERNSLIMQCEVSPPKDCIQLPYTLAPNIFLLNYPPVRKSYVFFGFSHKTLQAFLMSSFMFRPTHPT